MRRGADDDPFLTLLGLVSAVLLLAMDERNRRKFAAKADIEPAKAA